MSNFIVPHSKCFSWLVRNDNQPQTTMRLNVFKQWAAEMACFQNEANRSGKPVEYYQRGRVIRIFYPAKSKITDI